MKTHRKTLRLESADEFILLLKRMCKTGCWHAHTEEKCIYLRRNGVRAKFSPLTAVYYELIKQKRKKGVVLDTGSFWHPDLTRKFGLPWWEVNRIAYAEIACGCGNRCDWALRDQILAALGLPKERSNLNTAPPTTKTSAALN